MSDADAARLNTARGNVIKELIATERDYVNDLDVIVKVFIEPLREQALMNEKEILGVFLNVELLVAVNRELLAQLESAIALCPDEPHKCLVGKPLKQMVRARSIQRLGLAWMAAVDWRGVELVTDRLCTCAGAVYEDVQQLLQQPAVGHGAAAIHHRRAIRSPRVPRGTLAQPPAAHNAATVIW